MVDEKQKTLLLFNLRKEKSFEKTFFVFGSKINEGMESHTDDT
jgi:hypothetical protein